MKRIQIINGPNLNLLGKREPAIYGDASFEGYLEKLRERYPQCEISYYQSNIEGEMINKIHDVHARESFRHVSMISPACKGIVIGFGLDSYRLALESFIG